MENLMPQREEENRRLWMFKSESKQTRASPDAGWKINGGLPSGVALFSEGLHAGISETVRGYDEGCRGSTDQKSCLRVGSTGSRRKE